ncbi:hypothetical protein B7463_g3718, partial [Scytalidium lignicola]
MSQYYNQASASPSAPENLQFYGGGYHTTPSQIGQPGYNTAAYREHGSLQTGWFAAFSAGGYENEPPLLEELDINLGHILAKTAAVLNPLSRIEQLENVMNDSDLAGPVLFVVLFGAFLFCSGKGHFGYIYGLGFMGSTALHMILSLMTPNTPSYSGSEPSNTLTFPRSASILGYCLLPLVLTSLVGVAIPLDCTLGYILTGLAICWSTTKSSAIFCAVGKMRNARGLVAYPVALLYAGFGIMSIFNSRGN